MAFKFVRPESVGLIKAAEAGDTKVGWDRAAATLRRDYERWSRLGLGVAAYVATFIGLVFTSLPFLVLADASHRRLTADDLIFMGVGCLIVLIFAGPGLYVLFRLWRSGRSISRAAGTWLTAPYKRGLRRAVASGWLDARMVNYEPRILTRLVTAAFLMLIAIGGIVGGIANPNDEPIMSVSFIAFGVVTALCTVGIFGGVQNIINGLAVRDPLWMRIKSAFTRDK